MVQLKSQWQQEFDSLPEWAQKMVRAAASITRYGSGLPTLPISEEEREQGATEFKAVIDGNSYSEWFDGFLGLKELATALTAPWPPPTDLPPHEKMTTNNIVEMTADEDCAFDQPCYFGYRVDTHAVYCHCDAWPNSPRKCRRNRANYRHEDCPGYVPNRVALDLALVP